MLSLVYLVFKLKCYPPGFSLEHPQGVGIVGIGFTGSQLNLLSRAPTNDPTSNHPQQPRFS